MFKKSILLAAGALAFTAASPAMAEPILLDSSDLGSTFTIDYDGFADGQTIDGISSTTAFTLTSITGNTYGFDYSVTNTTSGSGINSRLSSFAFNTDPDIVSASSTGVYDFVVTDSNYPNGIGTVDVCFKAAGSRSCAGNKGGLLAGETGTGTLSLTFADSPTAISLSDFFVRYQSITGVYGITSASGQQTGSSSSSSSGGTPVPAPGMLGIFGLAIMGLGFFRRQRLPQPNRGPALA